MSSAMASCSSSSKRFHMNSKLSFLAATVLVATVACGSERAKIAVLDLGIGAAKGDFGQASDPAVFERALRGGCDVRRIGADELGSPAFFSVANCDLLIVPTGSLFPMTAASNLVTFLKNRGQLLTCGGYAFDTPAVQRGGKWVSPKGLAGTCRLPADRRRRHGDGSGVLVVDLSDAAADEVEFAAAIRRPGRPGRRRPRRTSGRRPARGRPRSHNSGPVL